MARLAVKVDGQAMPEDEARAIWARFSTYMEEHRGDLAGFAKQEGFASVHPEMGADGAVLVLSRTAPQRAYTNAKPTASAGPSRSGGPPMIQGRGQKRGK
jgi:hypothetical protein